MRDKILKYISLTMVSFEKNAEAIAARLQEQFRDGHGGELPENFVDAVKAVNRALRDTRDVVEGKIVDIFEELFTQGNVDIDALIAYQESDACKRLSDLTPALIERVGLATNGWINQTIQSIEPELQRLLGTPAPAALEPTVVVAPPDTAA